jgi:hypothetical protein
LKIDSKNQPTQNPNQKTMSYRLATNWLSLIEDVRKERLVSPTAASWKNGMKHGLQEGSVSRDIVSFVSRRVNQMATREEIIAGLPTAFTETNAKTQDGSAQEYLRELVKMGILDKL